MIARRNPLAKLAAALVIALALITSIDRVSASIALAAVLVASMLAGLSLRRFFAVTWPILIAAPLSGLTTLLYGIPAGETYLQWGLIHISDGSIELAIATALRVMAIGLPAVVMFVTIDPTDLADALGQLTRLPARFVIGALASLRLIELFRSDWQSLRRARRARGLGDRHGLGAFLRTAFSMLVLSIRRATKLAVAMDARGFGAATTRTWARPSRFGRADWALVLGAAIVAATAIGVAVWAGTWRFILGGGTA